MDLKKVRLYDTYAGKIVDLEPVVPGEVSIYYCGPTVYNYVHIGNLRPVITFDLLSRVLRECGYKVHMVSNYTDIDDRIIKKSLEEGKSEKELSDFYIAAYEENLSKLNIIPLEYHPRVSNYIPQIVSFITEIVDKGHGYKSTDGDVYFSVMDDPYYGSLSKMNIPDLIAGSRVEMNQGKKCPLDFALWKITDDKGIKFDTSLGKGRPGWHTECVVMINSYFHKPLIDIHGGGFDLKFPHHENEMAQSWATSGTRLANIWMHVGFIDIDNVKMSKSLGNVVLAKDAIEKYGSNVIRHLFLTTYYRSPINFTEEAVMTSKIEVDKYGNLLHQLQAYAFLNEKKFSADIDQAEYNEFLGFLADDLNVANAITVLEKVVKAANKSLRNSCVSFDELSREYATYYKMLDTLGFTYEDLKISNDVLELYHKYLECRQNKDFAESDSCRVILHAKGVL